MLQKGYNSDNHNRFLVVQHLGLADITLVKETIVMVSDKTSSKKHFVTYILFHSRRVNWLTWKRDNLSVCHTTVQQCCTSDACDLLISPCYAIVEPQLCSIVYQKFEGSRDLGHAPFGECYLCARNCFFSCFFRLVMAYSLI